MKCKSTQLISNSAAIFICFSMVFGKGMGWAQGAQVVTDHRKSSADSELMCGKAVFKLATLKG